MRYPHHPGHRGQDTSMEAAEALSKSLARQQRLVNIAVQEATICGADGKNGCTTIQAANSLGLDHHSVGKRISELKQMGLVVDSGQRLKNPSGRNARVWIAVQQPPVAMPLPAAPPTDAPKKNDPPAVR